MALVCADLAFFLSLIHLFEFSLPFSHSSSLFMGRFQVNKGLPLRSNHLAGPPFVCRYLLALGSQSCTAGARGLASKPLLSYLKEGVKCQ